MDEIVETHNYASPKFCVSTCCIKKKCLFAFAKKTIMSTEMIETIREYFKTQPVLKAWIFGSYARGEETEDSDVDILVVFDRNARVSLIGHATMMLDLEDLLNRKVDLVKEGTLLPFAVETANRDKVLIYEKSA